MPDPQMAYRVSTINIPNEAFIVGAPTAGFVNGTILTVPLNANVSIEVESVSISCYVSVIDGSDDVSIAIKTVSASGGTGTTLATGISIKSTNLTSKYGMELWRGRTVLTAGMSLEYEITSVTPDTAGFGYALTAESHLVERSGA